MNAAGRLVHQGVLMRPFVLVHVVGKRLTLPMLLVLAVVITAFSIIYTTQTTRLLNAAYNQQVIEENQLHVDRSKLVLERSMWQMQARTQQTAERKLHMVLPDRLQVVMLRE